MPRNQGLDNPRIQSPLWLHSVHRPILQPCCTSKNQETVFSEAEGAIEGGARVICDARHEYVPVGTEVGEDEHLGCPGGKRSSWVTLFRGFQVCGRQI